VLLLRRARCTFSKPHTLELQINAKNVNGFDTIPQEENHMCAARMAIVFLMAASFAGPLARAQSDRTQSETALRQLEQQLVEAASRNDWQFWDRVVAREWTSIDQFGRQWDKPAILAMMKSFKGSIQSAKLYDVQVRFFRDDVAMVTGVATETGSGSGRVVKITFRSTDILVYRAGKWLVVASQATPIKDVR
jgi:uncharacterized protein DUF4440